MTSFSHQLLRKYTDAPHSRFDSREFMLVEYCPALHTVRRIRIRMQHHVALLRQGLSVVPPVRVSLYPERSNRGHVEQLA